MYFLLFLTTHLSGCRTTQREEQESELYGTIAGTALTEKQVRSAISQAGFPRAAVNKMVCTAWYESNWHTASRNRNRNGSNDFGLLQINSANWKWCRVTKASLANPATNAKCGYKIFRSQGMNAWYGYRAHKRKCNTYAGGRLKITEDLSPEELSEVMTDKERADFEEHARTDGPSSEIDMLDMSNGIDAPESNWDPDSEAEPATDFNPDSDVKPESATNPGGDVTPDGEREIDTDTNPETFLDEKD
jgi:hypothetical protein